MGDTSNTQLKKQLGLGSVYAIATGATLSAGLFLLPGLAAQQVGPAVVLCYLLAAVPLIPAMLCIVELSTAMPRAGGSYYFLERSLGPLLGTIGGFGTWLAIALKTSFALVGLAATVSLLFEPNPWLLKPLAIGFAVLFAGLNAMGARHSGGLQKILVVLLLSILTVFLAVGLPEMRVEHFGGFLDAGSESILATAGLVYISYVGVTNVASVSEEVSDPERNLPRGIFLSLITALLIYGLATAVMVGVMPPAELAGNMTPMSSAAHIIGGRTGMIVVSVGAVLAFFSVANAGIMAASRYPLAMGRDDLVPPALSKLDKNGTPLVSIMVTVALIISVILFFDPIKIAKLASAFQLMMFALLCLAVIIMRESGLASYDPGYRTPLYPWIPIFGILSPFFLIIQMGWLPTAFSLGLIAAGIAWFQFYGSSRVKRTGAIYHVFERLGRSRHEALDVELRTILKEKGLRDADPFEEVVLGAQVIEVETVPDFDRLIEQVAEALAERTGGPREVFIGGFREGTKMGATPVAKGVALPHMYLPDIEQPLLVLVRSIKDFQILTGDVFGKTQLTDAVHAAFFLVSPKGDPSRHLRMLAQLANRIDRDDFDTAWRSAPNEMSLREVFLRDDRYLSLRLTPGSESEPWIDQQLFELGLPDGCLVAAIRRRNKTMIPRGATRLEKGDRLLLFGEPQALNTIRKQLGLSNAPNVT